MESSGGGGFGFAHQRDLERLGSDWEDGLISESGLSAYAAEIDGSRVVRNGRAVVEVPARLIIGQREMTSTQCAVSQTLARDLELQSGQMVEVVPDLGPALRFWVDGFEDVDEAMVLLSADWRELVAEGEIKLRATATGTPYYVRSQR